MAFCAVLHVWDMLLLAFFYVVLVAVVPGLLLVGCLHCCC
jgi:hypothetical protein